MQKLAYLAAIGVIAGAHAAAAQAPGLKVPTVNPATGFHSAIHSAAAVAPAAPSAAYAAAEARGRPMLAAAAAMPRSGGAMLSSAPQSAGQAQLASFTPPDAASPDSKMLARGTVPSSRSAAERPALPFASRSASLRTPQGKIDPPVGMRSSAKKARAKPR